MASLAEITRPATNIDRRQCKRTVPLEVLVLGQSRTGTTSIRAALYGLGYNDVYHYSSVIRENPRDSEMWLDAYKAKFEGVGKPYGREEFDKLLGHCQVSSINRVHSHHHTKTNISIHRLSQITHVPHSALNSSPPIQMPKSCSASVTMSIPGTNPSRQPSGPSSSFASAHNKAGKSS